MPIWVIYSLASMVFAGLTSVIAKFGLKNVPSDLALAIRTTAVFVIIWLNAFSFRYTTQFSNFTKRDIDFLCISGITTLLSWIFYVYDNRRVANIWFMAAMVERKFKEGSIVLNCENLLDQRQSKFEPLVEGTMTQPLFNPVWGPLEGRVINLSIKIIL